MHAKICEETRRQICNNKTSALGRSRSRTPRSGLQKFPISSCGTAPHVGIFSFLLLATPKQPSPSLPGAWHGQPHLGLKRLSDCFFGDHSQAYLIIFLHQLDPRLLFTRSSRVPSSLPKCFSAKELWFLQLVSWKSYAPLSQMWTVKPLFSSHHSWDCKYLSPNFSPGL